MIIAMVVAERSAIQTFSSALDADTALASPATAARTATDHAAVGTNASKTLSSKLQTRSPTPRPKIYEEQDKNYGTSKTVTTGVAFKNAKISD